MEISQEKFKEILVPPGHLTEEQFFAVVKESQRKKNSLQVELVEEGFITDDNLGRTIADFFDCHYANLHEVDIQDSFLEFFPEVVARAQRAVVFGVDAEQKTVNLATEYIDNYEFFALLEKKLEKKIAISYTTAANIDRALKFYKGDLHDKIYTLVENCIKDQQEGDIVRLVDLFLEYANDNRSSDIHIEPIEGEVLVRFRVDGILHEAVRYPDVLHEKIVFRIKIMAHMQTDEHATAQDGRFDYEGGDSVFDVRVSILPVTDGENIVMRILDAHTHRYSLENLGLREFDYQKVLAAVQKPHGMIMAVGPTGSGKTTVLYTVLEKLNSPEVNIMTIEDPVEYDIDGVQQTQVNPKKNLTFANGLRSIVRQDPDIIMVGEIRDEETADIAINSALTGHLVISTLHTNDSATTFPRLMEMGVEPFLIASSVNIIIALRLVRKICDHCKESYIPTPSEIEILRLNPNIIGCITTINGNDDLSKLRLYKGMGCKFCNTTGYSERIGIFEVLEMTEDIRVLITQKASSDVINAKAISNGMSPLLCDGIAKVLNGVTTIEEVIKVASM